MTEKLTDKELQLCQTALDLCPTLNMKRASRAIAKFYDEALHGAAISSGQLALLLAIARNGSSSYGQLSRELLIDKTAVGRATKALAERGWVSVDSIKGSRRKSVSITKAGIACLREAVPLWQSATEQFLESFGEQDWRRLRTDLSRTSKVIP